MDHIRLSISVFHFTTDGPQPPPSYPTMTNYPRLKDKPFCIFQDLYLPSTLMCYIYKNYGDLRCEFVPMLPSNTIHIHIVLHIHILHIYVYKMELNFLSQSKKIIGSFLGESPNEFIPLTPTPTDETPSTRRVFTW